MISSIMEEIINISSGSDGESVSSGEIPAENIIGDLTGRRSTSKRISIRALRKFIEDNHLKKCRRLDEIGYGVETNPNGNCGYEALLVALWQNGLLHPYIKSMDSDDVWTRPQKEQDLQWQREQINAIRERLRNHYRINWWFYKGNTPWRLKIKTADGSPIGTFKCNQRAAKRIFNSIWTEGVDYSDGCTYDSWMNVNYFAIAADHFKRTIFVYELGDRNHRRTIIYHYDNDTDTVVNYIQEYYFLSPTDGALCIVYDGMNHYEYLRVTLITCDQIFSAFKKFGPVQNTTNCPWNEKVCVF